MTLTLNYSRAKKKKVGIVRHGWSKPKEDFVKLNVDVGFSIDSGAPVQFFGTIEVFSLLLVVVEFLLFLMHLLQKHEHCETGYFLLVILVVIG
jgi:hypothetical protein